MQKVDIGIIGAMEEEIKKILPEIKNPITERISGVDFIVGELRGRRVSVARCGIGKVFSALCAEAMILRYSPNLVVNTGVGGAISAGISAGDIVIAERLVQHDMDTSPLGDPKGLISGINKIYFDANERAIKILLEAAHERGIRVFSGTIASGDQFIADSEKKHFIRDEFSASVCEMEGAALAQVAYVNNTPFAVIRAISDSADEESSMDYREFLPLAAERSANLVLSLVERF